MKPTAEPSHEHEAVLRMIRILYPMADARLSPDQQESLETCFAEVEKNIVGEGEYEEFHRLLESLEKTYLAL